MSPSLDYFIGFGASLEEGVEGSIIDAKDALRGPECYDYAHYHPDWNHEWSDDKKEQFEVERRHEIEAAKQEWEKQWSKYAESIETEVIGVRDFVRDVVFYEPTLQTGYASTSTVDPDDLDITTELRLKAVEQIERYFDLLGITEDDICKGPEWLMGASYW